MLELNTNYGADNRRVDERQYNITELWDRQQEIVRRLSLGQSAVDIARDLSISPVTVSYVRNSPLGQEALAKLHSAANNEAVNIAKRIKEVAPKALAVLEGILDNSIQGTYDLPADRKTAASVAMGLLDRAGHAPIHRQISMTVPVSNSVINEIKERAKGAGMIGIKEAEVKVEAEEAKVTDIT